jgi:TetR/AcrR family transcriptional regulator, fatty acid metabolism regulator protein
MINEHILIYVSRQGGRDITSSAKNNDKTGRILKAAGKVFAEKGYYQSTISMISKEADVADGTIYLYFKSKEDLYIRLFRYRTEQVFGRFRDAVDQAAGAREKLKSLIRRHLEEFQKDRDMAVTYQLETHSHRRLAGEPIREMSKRYMDIITEILELGQEEGWIRKNLYLGLVKRLIIGAVDEVINTWVHAEGKYDLRTMADPLVDLLINGIATTSGPVNPDVGD